MTSKSREIGLQLRAAREELNYTLDDLAETCGLTVSEISEVEEGTSASPDYARRIALSLGVSLD